MELNKELISLDECAENDGKVVQLIEQDIKDRDNLLMAYVAFSTAPVLWLYKWCDDHQKPCYQGEVVPSGILEILDYRLVSWVADRSIGKFLAPDYKLGARPFDYEPKMFEKFQFRDNQGRYYRIPKARDNQGCYYSVVPEFNRGDILIPKDARYSVWAKRFLDEHDGNKDIAVYLLVAKFGKNGTDKVTPYLSVHKAGEIVGISKLNKKGDDKKPENYRSSVNRAINRGKRQLKNQ